MKNNRTDSSPRSSRPIAKWTWAVSAGLGLLSACGADASNADFVDEELFDQQQHELIGGTVAPPYHFRSTVAIGDVCTAAKVGPRSYLTAAHCVVDPNELAGGLTPTNAPNRDGIAAKFSPGASIPIAYGIQVNDSSQRATVKVVKTHVHPTWLEYMNHRQRPGVVGGADIAVIKVDRDLPQIPEARVELGEIQPGTLVVKGGFGCEDHALRPESPLNRYKTAFATVLPPSELLLGWNDVQTELERQVVDASYLVTSGRLRDEEQASICKGDSGGPLYLNHNSDRRVVGVNSDYQLFDGISYTDWHTRTSLRSRHSVGRWLSGLDVNTVGGDLIEGKGGLTLERWNNVSGTHVSLIPVNRAPDSTQNITDFEIYPGSGNNGDNYGVRVRGYLTAPKTGYYQFWIAGDDNASLYLSSNDNPSNRQRIAYHEAWTGPREWTKFQSTQESPRRHLVQGQRYYIEALMKEGIQNDNLAVGWIQPGQDAFTSPMQVVPSYLLTPFSNASECTCRKGCNAVKTVTAPKQFTGYDENCYFFPNLGSSVTSSNMSRVNINGVDLPNRTVYRASYPAPRDGGYYVFLESASPSGSTTFAN
jgi:V8-like Glu-specific endopeptidase